MSSKERIRYGRKLNGSPKNTLITTEIDGEVYFGISRCNESMGDSFKKDKGILIATNRKNLAIQERNNSHEYIIQPDISLTIHESGLRGVIVKQNVKKLISYFNTIDTEKPGHTLTLSKWLHS